MSASTASEIQSYIIAQARELGDGYAGQRQLVERIRFWALDLAPSMDTVYQSVSVYETEIEKTLTKRAIAAAAKVITLDEEYLQQRNNVTAVFAKVDAAVYAADLEEATASGSSAFAASRAAMQAIQMSVSMAEDSDVFSLLPKAGALAQLCLLAKAYERHAALYPDGKEATIQEGLNLLWDVTEEYGAMLLSSLQSRVQSNEPGDIDLTSTPTAFKI